MKDSPTPPKVQAPPPPEWAVKAASEVLGTYWEGRGPPFDREAKASAAIIAKHAPSPAPASEGRSEELRAGIKQTLTDYYHIPTVGIDAATDRILALLAHYPGAGVEALGKVSALTDGPIKLGTSITRLSVM